jgi:hypothetical protein
MDSPKKVPVLVGYTKSTELSLFETERKEQVFWNWFLAQRVHV